MDKSTNHNEDIRLAIVLTEAIHKTGNFMCQRKDTLISVVPLYIYRYLTDDFKKPIVIKVRDGRYFSNMSFWSPNAVILYLYDPTISFRSAFIKSASKNYRFLLKRQTLCRPTNSSKVIIVDVIVLTNGAEIWVYDVPGWYNYCQIYYVHLRRGIILDKIVDNKATEKILMYCDNKGDYPLLFD